MPLEPWVVLAALVIEAACGYPARLQRVIPHPVRGIGRVLEAFEIRWNNPARSDIRRRMLGVLTLLLVTSATHRGSPNAVCMIMRPMCGKSSMRAISKLHGARCLKSWAETRHGSTKAAIESLAESFNDAIIAPAFWLFVAGLPGLFAYKTINTADSMIGHFEPRWRAFGWASARADDFVNLIPARLAGLLITLAGAGGLRTMLRDAMQHASPNAGWTEAAMAGALAVQLGGPTTYDDHVHQRPQFGDGRAPVADDLNRAMRLYVRACIVLWIAFALLEMLWLH